MKMTDAANDGNDAIALQTCKEMNSRKICVILILQEIVNEMVQWECVYIQSLLDISFL